MVRSRTRDERLVASLIAEVRGRVGLGDREEREPEENELEEGQEHAEGDEVE